MNMRSTNNCGSTRASTIKSDSHGLRKVPLIFDMPSRDETHAEHADPREALDTPVTEERIENTGKTANWISPECRMRSKI